MRRPRPEVVSGALFKEKIQMSEKKFLKESIKLGDKDLTVETGRVAKQADGSVVIRYGDTMLLVAAVSALTPREGVDFFPLTVEYREANYAAGRIPGNYFRREGRPNEKEVLTCRLMDRPCRPLFAEGFKNETQVIASVISADEQNDPDVIAITGASCALYLSDIPFPQPIAGVRVGLIGGNYIINPTYDEVRESELNLIVAGTEEAIVMVEAGAKEVTEEIMVEALMLAHKEINRLCRWQKELYKALEIEKRPVTPPALDEEMLAQIERDYADKLRAALDTEAQGKQASYAAVDALKADEQFMDDLESGEIKRRFLLHYNFPHYSVGEVGRFGSTSRREIGHGALARRALEPVLPTEEEFPYSLRIVSDIAGAEDHYGDMDFKVAGTRDGITALQMDIKIAGINAQIMAEALEQAKKGRMHILSIMEQAIPAAREELSPYAPRIITIKINPDRIRDVIGPGGKMIRSIVEETGAKIDVEDDGTIFIATADGEAAQAAVARIRGLTAEAEIGETYLGTVSRIVDFGAFVEIFPGTDGLLHISEIAEHRVRDVRDELKEGQQILVKCIGKEGNKIKLSRKAVLKDEKQKAGGGGRAEAAGQGDGD